MVVLRLTTPSNVTLQQWSWIATSLGGVITGLAALQEWDLSREQNARELRWKKGKLAMEVIDAMKADPFANKAMIMLDWTNRDFVLTSGKIARIRFEDLTGGLREHIPGKFEFSESESFIRDCFDHFADHLQRIGHLIEIGLIHPEDVRHPLKYWAQRMAHKDICKTGDPVRQFLKVYEYDLALALVQELVSSPAQTEIDNAALSA